MSGRDSPSAASEGPTPPEGEEGGRGGPASAVTAGEVGEASEDGGGSRSAWLVGAGIFLSRISGFVRESTLAYFFGASGVLDVWRAALRTPNVVQNLLGEGTLSASFIPVYAEFLEEGRDEDAGRFAGAALGLIAVAAFGAALVGILLAPVLVPLFYPRFSDGQQELAIHLIRILFLMTALLSLSAWALGILNSHRKFFVSYVAPVVWNVAMVGTLVGLGGWLGWASVDLVTALAWGALAGGLLQVLVQLPWVVPVLNHFRLSVSLQVAGVKEAVSNFVPVVAARGVINLSGWLDTILAALLTTGALSILGYVQTLYMLPISLFGMAIAASELPELSRNRERMREVLVPRVRGALERLAFFLLPSVAAYLVLGDLFLAALFQRGRFDATTTTASYVVLAAYTLGLTASASSRALSSAYYAIRDTRTPARIAYLRVATSAVLGAALMFPLDRFQVGSGEDALRLGATGLALGTAVGAWLEYALLRRSLRGTLGSHGPRKGRVGRIALAAAAGAIAGAGAKWLLGSLVPLRLGLLAEVIPPDSALYFPVLAAGTGLAFGVVYLAATSALGVGVPLRSILHRFR